MNLARDCDVAAALRAGAPKARGLFVVSPVTADIDGSRADPNRELSPRAGGSVWISSGIYTGLGGEAAEFAIRLSPKPTSPPGTIFGLRRIAKSAPSPTNPV